MFMTIERSIGEPDVTESLVIEQLAAHWKRVAEDPLRSEYSRSFAARLYDQLRHEHPDIVDPQPKKWWQKLFS